MWHDYVDQQEDKELFDLLCEAQQANHIPGFIHNMSGPLGTLIGRAELMKMSSEEINGLDDLLQAAYRIQSVIENFGFRIMHENHPEPLTFDLNQFLRISVTNLQNDLFFKHQVHANVKYLSSEIAVQADFKALSGLFVYMWQFLRSFAGGKNMYSVEAQTTRLNEDAAIQLSMLGEFMNTAENSVVLPFKFKGSELDVTKTDLSLPNNRFLTECLHRLNAALSVSGNEEKIAVIISIPHTSIPHTK